MGEALPRTGAIAGAVAVAMALSTMGPVAPAAAATPITGVVTAGGPGHPVADVEVTLYAVEDDDWEWVDSTGTDASGRYSLTTPSDTGSYRIGFSKAGFRQEYFDDKLALESATALRAGAVANADLQALLSVTGTVTQSGAPSSETEVVLYRLADDGEGGRSWQWTDSAQTGLDGKYRLYLPGDSAPDEDFRVQFSKYEWIPEFFDDKASVERADDVSAGDVVDADLAPQPFIRGTVTEAGVASSDTAVTIWRKDGDDWTEHDQTYTGLDGTYKLLLPYDGPVGEKFRVSFAKDGWVTEFYDGKFSVEEGKDVSGGDVVNAELSQGARIAGTVTELGTEASDVSVVALKRTAPDSWVVASRATTDEDGTYAMAVDPGDVVVRFTKPGWRTEYFHDAASIAKATVVHATGGASGLDQVDADLARGPWIENLYGSLSPADLADELGGRGVKVTSATLTGDSGAAGRFQRFDASGFGHGVVLSSGYADELLGPNVSSRTGSDLDSAGDADLTALGAGPTRDAAVLTLKFVPAGPQLRLRYVFGSEEYNELVGSAQDVLAIMVNGANCAKVPSGQRVSAATINAKANATLFRNNDRRPVSPVDTELDGLTKPLTCVANVAKGKTNTLKIAIADGGDNAMRDSAVFLEGDSLLANNAPVARAQSVVTRLGVAKAVTLAGVDADNDRLTYAIRTRPAHGTLAGTAPRLTYRPKAGYAGRDSFTFTVSDGLAVSAPATVTITVNKLTPRLVGMPKSVAVYNKAKRAAWLKSPAVRLPAKTNLAQPVGYASLTPAVCTPDRFQGVWRVKGLKAGTCSLRARAAATPRATALNVTFRVAIKK